MKKKEIKEKYEKLKKTGFFSIFVSNVFAKVIAFFGNIIVVRILTKNDYGVYAYALNAMMMLYIFNDFGASTSALQSLTEEHNNKKRQKLILKYAIKIGFIGSLFSGILILLSPLFYPFEIIEAKYYTPILCLIPLLSNVISFISVVLRANLENKKFAILNFGQTFLNYIFLIVLSIMFGIKGAIISQYCYTILAVIIGMLLSKNVLGKFDNNKVNSNSIDKEEKRKFLKYAISAQINNTLDSLLLNIDLFFVGFIIANSEIVASYKVATTIPMALSFLPNCVMIYVLPYFVLHNKDYDWIGRNYRKLIKYGAIGYSAISLSCCILSKVIFNILYGVEYYNALVSFNILMIGFFFSATIKIPTNNILYSMRKLKFNLIVTICSTALNVILNIIFVKKFGMDGAAITTTTINIISSIALCIYSRRCIKKVK